MFERFKRVLSKIWDVLSIVLLGFLIVCFVILASLATHLWLLPITLLRGVIKAIATPFSILLLPFTHIAKMGFTLKSLKRTIIGTLAYLADAIFTLAIKPIYLLTVAFSRVLNDNEPSYKSLLKSYRREWTLLKNIFREIRYPSTRWLAKHNTSVDYAFRAYGLPREWNDRLNVNQMQDLWVNLDEQNGEQALLQILLVDRNGQNVHNQAVEKDVEKIFIHLRDHYSASCNLDNTLAEFTLYRNRLATRNLSQAPRLKQLECQACVNFMDTVINQTGHTLTTYHDVTLRDITLWIFSYALDSQNWKPEWIVDAKAEAIKAQIELNDAEIIEAVKANILEESFQKIYYECQRAYNISPEGRDNLRVVDSPSCFGGTVNRQFYGLNTIVKDFEIKYVSMTTSTYKLTALAQKEIIRYGLKHPEVIADAKLDSKNGEAPILTFDQLEVSAQEKAKLKIARKYSKEFNFFSDYKTACNDFMENGIEYVEAAIPLERKASISESLPPSRSFSRTDSVRA